MNTAPLALSGNPKLCFLSVAVSRVDHCPRLSDFAHYTFLDREHAILVRRRRNGVSRIEAFPNWSLGTREPWLVVRPGLVFVRSIRSRKPLLFAAGNFM